MALTWDAIDLDAGTLWVKVAIHRSPWEHGCRSPGRCTYRNSKGQVVPAKRGADCPQRVGGGFRVDDPKTTGSRRPLALSAPMIGHLRSHRAGQQKERLAAGSMWRGAPNGGLVFATETGQPLARKADWADWRDLLIAAGVPHRRVHDARHTAATLLLLQGVSETAVMMMFGWSQKSTMQRYQHFVGPVARQVAAAMDDALGLGTPKPKPRKRRGQAS